MILFGFAAGLLAVLTLGFAVAGAPVTIAGVPLALVAALALAVGRDLRHVARHGWYSRRGADGSSGGGGHNDPREPSPQLPSGDAADIDWDSFVSDFWDHVERELVGA